MWRINVCDALNVSHDVMKCEIWRILTNIEYFLTFLISSEGTDGSRVAIREFYIVWKTKKIFCKFWNVVTFWSSTWVILQIMFKIHLNLFATIYFGTLHLWPLLNVGRCSEVVLSYKSLIRDKKSVVVLEKWSLAQFWLHLYFKSNSVVRYVTYG